MKVSIIIPVFKSELIIDQLLKELLESLTSLSTPVSYEIFLVNDNGLDTCWLKIKQLVKKHPQIKGLALDKNYGQHNAVMAGFNFCSGDYIITMDDDLQHPPQYIGPIIEKLLQGFDVCYTNYVNRKHAFWKHLVSWINNIISSHLLNKPYKLYLSSFRGLKRNIMMQIIKNKSNDIYIDSIILKLSPKITSIPINHQTRFQGQSTYSFSKLISLWLNMAKDSAARPFRFFSFFILILKLILLFKKKIKDIEQFKIIEKTF
tara:strand:+ start:5730 stop:6512 length:783 start_codon:yes stop_codon:yes gene_type:complete